MPRGPDHTPTLKVGDPAPDFTLRATGKRTVKLSDFRGQKNVLIAFYPAAWTPVWSAQMPSYQADLAKFEGYNTQVLGVSVDNVYSNEAWAKSLGGISYPLCSDFYPHGEVARRYGILRDDGITERGLFVVDKKGIIRYIDVHPIGEKPDSAEIFQVLSRL